MRQEMNYLNWKFPNQGRRCHRIQASRNREEWWEWATSKYWFNDTTFSETHTWQTGEWIEESIHRVQRYFPHSALEWSTGRLSLMIIEFKNSELPVKVKLWTSSPEQLEFLKTNVRELSEAGLIHRSNMSKCACAPLVVPKQGKEDCRFTVDLRPVNALTKKNLWPMPDPEAMMTKLEGSQIWFSLDFIHGYWQFPLEKKSRECQSFHTPFWVYTPTAVLHGATNAAYYSQSSMESIFSD